MKVSGETDIYIFAEMRTTDLKKKTVTHGNKGSNSAKTGQHSRLNGVSDLRKDGEPSRNQLLVSGFLTSMLIIVSELYGSDQKMGKQDTEVSYPRRPLLDLWNMMQETTVITTSPATV